MSSPSLQIAGSIPVSRFAPVALQRPLRLFGRTFQVHISSPLTFAPVTVLQGAFGITPLQLLRQDKHRPDMALRALWRGMTRKNRLSPTTRKHVVRNFGRAFSSEILESLLSGEEPAQKLPADSDWEVLQRSIGAP